MEYDITDTIANFVRRADPGFEQQMEEQAQALGLLCCVNIFYGRWVEMGVEFLFSALELEDRDFATRLPALAHLNKPERRRFLEQMKDHLHACQYCALQHKHELELNARIEEAFQENTRSLLQQLQANSPTS
jgi:hypothetical protein